jgi:hypothetical protein
VSTGNGAHQAVLRRRLAITGQTGACAPSSGCGPARGTLRSPGDGPVAAQWCCTGAILTLKCQRLASSSRSQITARMASAATYLTWEASSTAVRWRPSLAMAIVTHLVTRPVGTLDRLRQRRTISLGTSLSCLPDHSICSSAAIFAVRECPLRTFSDRAIGHARGTTCRRSR